MSYRVNRAAGYQKPGVTNPWVFADFGQPQRRRGYVSPIVYQSREPGLRTIHLGDDAADRAVRMEHYTLIGLTLSVLSLGMFAYHLFRQRSVKNVARNGRRRVQRNVTYESGATRRRRASGVLSMLGLDTGPLEEIERAAEKKRVAKNRRRR